jgi:hypothetical protein
MPARQRHRSAEGDVEPLGIMGDLLMFLGGSLAITLWALVGLVLDELRRQVAQGAPATGPDARTTLPFGDAAPRSKLLRDWLA